MLKSGCFSGSGKAPSAACSATSLYPSHPSIFRNMITASGERGLSHHQQVQIFSEALTSFREDLRREGKDDSLWHGARIIYSTSRTISPGHSNNKVVNEIGSLREYMEDCLELKMAFPDIICGELSVSISSGLLRSSKRCENSMLSNSKASTW